ncbi:hypothetical protein XELAEV_18037251mg [Xenopus laevis]|uniref:GIY-YIG domain-containing protein n=1 Tax=Xenopus laevis TaxID=8355 RepID=A0A974CC02_XENLA|nr:hypothetical protein XELAEV_18037251mg [Xenopus laevis]
MKNRFREQGYNRINIQRAFVRAVITDGDELLVPKNKEQSRQFAKRSHDTVPYDVQESPACIMTYTDKTIKRSRCGSNRCLTCKYLKSQEIRSTVTRKTYSIKQFVNCNSTGVIYLITCKKCNKQYIGCTMISAKERIREHINQISNVKYCNKTNVTRHFAECSDRNLKYFSVQVIEQIKTGIRGGDMLTLLHEREVYWIFYLKTRLQVGLNYTFDVICFI